MTRRRNKQEEIDYLNEQLRKHKAEDSASRQEIESGYRSVIDQKDENIKELNQELKQRLSEMENKDEQIQTMELKRFAQAYADQESEYKTEGEKWFKYGFITSVLLATSVLASIFSVYIPRISGTWYENPGFYLLNLIFITLFVYALKQHLHFGKLRIDYANRKTLAQSYQYIIEDEEDKDVAKRFLERAADVFSSRADLTSGDVTPQEGFLTKMFNRKKESVE
ncbi:MAG: hypothetical protein ISR99_00580 [Parcubacteria group bacterium]|nr:hypothetical protein [Parcubacteria group bacterium]